MTKSILEKNEFTSRYKAINSYPIIDGSRGKKSTQDLEARTGTVAMEK